MGDVLFAVDALLRACAPLATARGVGNTLERRKSSELKIVPCKTWDTTVAALVAYR